MAYGLSIGTTFGPVRWRVHYEVRKWTSPGKGEVKGGGRVAKGEDDLCFGVLSGHGKSRDKPTNLLQTLQFFQWINCL